MWKFQIHVPNKHISPILLDYVGTGPGIFSTLLPRAVTAEGDGSIGENPTISPPECSFLICLPLNSLFPALFSLSLLAQLPLV